MVTILSREALVAAIQVWPPQEDIKDTVRGELNDKGEGWIAAHPHLLTEPEPIFHAAGFRWSERKLYVEWHGLHLWFSQHDVQDLIRD